MNHNTVPNNTRHVLVDYPRGEEVKVVVCLSDYNSVSCVVTSLGGSSDSILMITFSEPLCFRVSGLREFNVTYVSNYSIFKTFFRTCSLALC